MKEFKKLEIGDGIYLESKTEWRAVFKHTIGFNLWGGLLGEVANEEFVKTDSILTYEDASAYWRKWVAKQEFHTVKMFFSKNNLDEIVMAWRKNHVEKADPDFLSSLREIE